MTGVDRFTSTAASALGIVLIILGGANLHGIHALVEPMHGVGPTNEPTTFVGLILIILGGMLAHRPLNKVGSRLLAVWMTGAATFQWWAGNPMGAAIPFILAIVATLLAWQTRGAAWIPRDGIPAPLSSVPQASFRRVTGRLLNLIGMAFMVRWAIGGLLFWLSLPLMGLAQARMGNDRRGEAALHSVLLYLLFFGFGVGGLWNFFGHFFLSDLVAASTGWPAGNPFQHELAFFHLGSGVVGTLCLWWRDRFWIAAGLAPSIFACGAAFIHTREFLLQGNVTAANWGFGPVGANLIIPSIVLALLIVYLWRGGFDPDVAEHAPY